MSADARRQARAHALQTRICGLLPPLPTSPRELHAELRRCLQDASDDGKLKTPPHEIFKLLKLSPSPLPARGEAAITGGEKNFHRTPDKAHFARSDGAWFDFTITVSYGPGALTLLAYDFEIRFPERVKPAFVRFDLNPPDHDNEAIGLRSHLHPGSDDLSVPAPFMSPIELLDVLLHGLELPENPRTAG